MRVQHMRRVLVGVTIGLAMMVLGTGCAQQGEVYAPQSPSIQNYAQGVAAYQGGKSDEAAKALKDAIQGDPNLIMPRILLGRIAKESGDYTGAAEQYERLVQVDPYEPKHHYNLGVSYQMLQRLRDASVSYQNALKLAPNDFGSNMYLGLTYLAMGDAENAVKYTDKAAQIRPDSAEAQSNLALALDSRGDYVLAEKAYRKSLELAPLQAGVLANYGSNLLAQQKWTEAVQVYGEALKKQPTPYLYKRVGDAYAMGGRYDEAIKQYDLALKGNAKYCAAMNEQARVMTLQYQQGMELNDKLRDQALTLWRQSLEINANQPKVKTALEQWEKKMFSK